MKYVIIIKVGEGREDEVPRGLADRCYSLITTAFAELFGEGIIDIEVEKVLGGGVKLHLDD